MWWNVCRVGVPSLVGGMIWIGIRWKKDFIVFGTRASLRLQSIWIDMFVHSIVQFNVQEDSNMHEDTTTRKHESTTARKSTYSISEIREAITRLPEQFEQDTDVVNVT